MILSKSEDYINTIKGSDRFLSYRNAQRGPTLKELLPSKRLCLKHQELIKSLYEVTASQTVVALLDNILELITLWRQYGSLCLYIFFG